MNSNTYDYRKEYERWLGTVSIPELAEELRDMDEAQIEDAFYRDLAFGTGGLRGIIGAGTNRMNVCVVGRASQGLADHLKGQRGGCQGRPEASVVIGYDSRINSDVFAKRAAEVLAANGITVYCWPQLLPVPTVSFAVRELNASAGIMITASHNPSNYNGYKVYGPDGCQITNEAADSILACINELDIFEDVRSMDFEEALACGRIRYIDTDVLTAYIEEVKKQSVLFGDEADRDVAIVYSPLNGTGLVPVTRVLEESGFTNITVVEEQREPDGSFPTCPYPNPEIREAMELGLEYCRSCGADLLLATDPDCDRCGIAVKDNFNGSGRDEGNGPGSEYRLLSGNETGLLLLDYICSQRSRHGMMPADPVFVKTIVTMDLAEKIAEHYGVRTVNVLTGFKYIGEVIGRLENKDDYVFGFEESYGYLTGSYVRDKDAVNAAFMICEMFAYYKSRGISLIEKLDEIYGRYGYCLNTLHSYELPGSSGMAKMHSIMASFRRGLADIAGMEVIRTEDYSRGLNGLPKSDVLKFYTERGSVVVRPSGTEPKLKVYISVTAENRAAAEKAEQEIRADLELLII
ncbi:MAG: phospho-sugar mutase [Mogibacterium sp.]|nr:phospho-sugar mutase [Mogibacterium sp.]